MSPDVGSGRGENRWRSPDVAQCRWTLAPRLAPSDIVSNANVRMIGAFVSPVHDPADNFVQSGRAARAPGMAFTGNGFRDGTSWRQRAPLRGDPLDRPPQLDLRRQQPIAR